MLLTGSPTAFTERRDLVTDKLRDIRIKFGFVVEGRERDELCGNQNS